MTMNRPSFSLSEAAHLTGVSRSTIRRYRESDKFPDAFKNTKDEWMIPLENLLAAGLSPVDPSTKMVELTKQDQDTPKAGSEGMLSKDAREVNRLRRELEVERARREGVENVLEEVRRRANLAERSLAMLEAAKPAAPAEPVPHSPIAMPATQAAPQAPAEHHWSESPEGAYKVSAPEPAPKKGWRFWK